MLSSLRQNAKLQTSVSRDQKGFKPIRAFNLWRNDPQLWLLLPPEYYSTRSDYYPRTTADLGSGDF